ncbi:MAG: hypothetical protein ACFB21_14875, partial [Opitutales bacterium]
KLGKLLGQARTAEAAQAELREQGITTIEGAHTTPAALQYARGLEGIHADQLPLLVGVDAVLRGDRDVGEVVGAVTRGDF